MITDYQVVTATRIEDLQDRVRVKLESELATGRRLAILREEELVDHPAHLVFAQALVWSGRAKE
jgi:hypothetical protein